MTLPDVPRHSWNHELRQLRMPVMHAVPPLQRRCDSAPICLPSYSAQRQMLEDYTMLYKDMIIAGMVHVPCEQNMRTE